MTHDITGYDENKLTEKRAFEGTSERGVAPLCLVHYFAERTAYPPERNPKPPGRGRVAERRGNLIILEFAPPPRTPPQKWQGGSQSKSLWMRVCDALMLLLLIASLLGCLAAFRY